MKSFPLVLQANFSLVYNLCLLLLVLSLLSSLTSSFLQPPTKELWTGARSLFHLLLGGLSQSLAASIPQKQSPDAGAATIQASSECQNRRPNVFLGLHSPYCYQRSTGNAVSLSITLLKIVIYYIILFYY